MSRNEVLLNGDINFKEVRCVGDSGEVYGIISSKEALNIAQNLGLDLVLISASAKPPVCKVMDYNKFRYQNEKKIKEAKKNKSKLKSKRSSFPLKSRKTILTIKSSMRENLLNPTSMSNSKWS